LNLRTLERLLPSGTGEYSRRPCVYSSGEEGLSVVSRRSAGAPVHARMSPLRTDGGRRGRTEGSRVAFREGGTRAGCQVPPPPRVGYADRRGCGPGRAVAPHRGRHRHSGGRGGSSRGGARVPGARCATPLRAGAEAAQPMDDSFLLFVDRASGLRCHVGAGARGRGGSGDVCDFDNHRAPFDGDRSPEGEVGAAALGVGEGGTRGAGGRDSGDGVGSDRAGGAFRVDRGCDRRADAGVVTRPA